jgi:hypothetical protein
MKKYSMEQIINPHKLSFANKKFIQKSEVCGCFRCGSIFPPNQIIDWACESNERGETAFCPHCCIDSVIGDFNCRIDKQFLLEMKTFWFDGGTNAHIIFPKAYVDAFMELISRPTSQHST